MSESQWLVDWFGSRLMYLMLNRVKAWIKVLHVILLDLDGKTRPNLSPPLLEVSGVSFKNIYYLMEVLNQGKILCIRGVV